MSSSQVSDGRRRAVIDKVEPAVDRGRFPIKRVVGESILLRVDAFADGHDAVRCEALFRRAGESGWIRQPMVPLVNDAWQAELPLHEVGLFEYNVEAWVDHFQTWMRDLKKRMEAGQDVSVDLLIGAALISHTLDHEHVADEDRGLLAAWRALLSDAVQAVPRLQTGGTDELLQLMQRYPDRRFASQFDTTLRVVVDPVRARFSSWYELFPRSTSPEPGRHGTFADCIARLPYVAEMGFDVLYLPPIHPIGRSFRKGKNNNPVAEPGEAGSPWAIGAAEGGHKDILAEFGTLEDFCTLVKAAGRHGIDLALDIAFQCSPDHPYIAEHPEWFRQRPDGTIQYAENPPKKYQDIYPFDFESSDWRALWQELRDVFLYWCEQGVRVFRVDNPHTKAFGFWEWCIGQVKSQYPATIFLSEAFTRPKVMYRLAKLGFSQSYTYFTWRNTKQEFVEYFTELTQTELKEFFRPNLWPNTPDILVDHLQTGGLPAFAARLVLAATLGANYGIYGPAFELGEHLPLKPGSEEYLNSEKYEIRHWDLERPDSLRPLITQVNRIRRDNPALQSNDSLRFHAIGNENLLAYSKRDAASGNLMLVIVNLDFGRTQGGWLELLPDELGLPIDGAYQVHDLLSNSMFEWHGLRNYVELNPQVLPAHVFRIR